jgi:hypothetical protein
MSVIVAAVASLVGVVIGAGLASWLQRRAEIRKIFFDAMAGIAQVAGAQTWPSKSAPGGIEDPELSAELSHRMHSEFVDALVEARRSLGVASAICPELRSYLPRWSEAVMSPSERADLEEILKRGIRRATIRRRFR